MGELGTSVVVGTDIPPKGKAAQAVQAQVAGTVDGWEVVGRSYLLGIPRYWLGAHATLYLARYPPKSVLASIGLQRTVRYLAYQTLAAHRVA